MRLKPSDAKDLTSFWHSLTDINMLMTYSDEELEPHFDPLDPKLIKKVDWEELREITDVAFWDEEWKRLISRNIANPSLTKFVNFYIYFHIDSIAQEILEGTDKTKAERNEDFSFYDLLFNYKYLDKRAKKVFEIVSPHVENSRGWFLMDDETFISLLTEVVEESKPKKKAKKQAKKTNGKDTRKSK